MVVVYSFGDGLSNLAAAGGGAGLGGLLVDPVGAICGVMLGIVAGGLSRCKTVQDLASDDAEFDAEPLRLPVESVFRCLGHDEPTVRRFAADVIEQLLGQIRIAAYSEHLTHDQLETLTTDRP